MYAGCVAGAIQKSEYLQFISNQGFQNIQIQKEKPISIPDDILGKYLSEAEVKEFNTGTTGIFCITVYAEKQGSAEAKPNVKLADIKNTCDPSSNCC